MLRFARLLCLVLPASLLLTAATFQDRSAKSATGAAPIAGNGLITGSGTFRFDGRVVTPLLEKLPPAPEREACPECLEQEAETIPIGPGYRPELAGPRVPQTFLSSALKPQTALAPQDFTLFRNIENVVGAAPGVPANQVSGTDEPSLASDRSILFLTGNWWAAISRDSGLNWSYIDPYGYLPPPPGADSTTFCCDQVAWYDTNTDLLFWLRQYRVRGAGDRNIQRIAVAKHVHEALNNNAITWDVYTTSADNFGLPATGYQVDFPDLAATGSMLYASTNIYDLNTNSRVGSVIYRTAFADFADGTPIHYDYMRTGTEVSTLRLCQGATDIMYFAGHRNNTTLRAYLWGDVQTPGQIVWGDITHTGFPNGGWNAAGPDGRNFAQGCDNRILGAYVLHPTSGDPDTFLGFMWSVGLGNGYAYPWVQIVGSRSDAIVVSGSAGATLESGIWNNDYAWIYPAVTPNPRGDLGGTVCAGGGAFQPEARVYIADGGDWNAWESRLMAASTSGPPIPDATHPYRWGDFYTVRRASCGAQTWIAANYVQTGPNPGDGHPVVTWFGREADTPPADIAATMAVGPTGTLAPGAAVNVDVKVTNVGIGNSTLFTVKFYASPDSIINYEDYSLGTENLGPIPGGTSVVLHHAANLPPNIPDGFYHVIVSATNPGDCTITNDVSIAPDSFEVESPVPVELASFEVESAAGGLRVTWAFTPESDLVAASVERAPASDGPWSPVAGTPERDGEGYALLDPAVEPGTGYWYRLRAEDRAGVARVFGPVAAQTPPGEAVLLRARPNPSDGAVVIDFTLPADGRVSLRVFDVQGKQVALLADGPFPRGSHTLRWKGALDPGAARGIYFVRLATASGVVTRSVTLLR